MTVGDPLPLVAAKRYIHGSYRVLMSLKATSVADLIPVSPPSIETSVGIKACNHTCLSVLACEMWQYSEVYGCYVNAPGERPGARYGSVAPLIRDLTLDIAYPATVPAVFNPFHKFTGTVVAGEYIQRFCGPQPVARSPAESRVVTWAGEVVVPLAQKSLMSAVEVTRDVSKPVEHDAFELERPEASDASHSLLAASTIHGIWILPTCIMCVCIAMLLVRLCLKSAPAKQIRALLAEQDVEDGASDHSAQSGSDEDELSKDELYQSARFARIASSPHV